MSSNKKGNCRGKTTKYCNKGCYKFLLFMILGIVFSHELLFGQVENDNETFWIRESGSKLFVQDRMPVLFPPRTISHRREPKKRFPWASLKLEKQPQTIISNSDIFKPVSGPYGGVVRSIALDTSTNWLFIATDGEVYRSKNNGMSWDINLFPSQLHNCVEPVTILGPKVVVAETDFNTFISRDGGDSWDYLREDVRGFTVDTNGVIYAGSKYGGVKMSTDTAKSWQQFALPEKSIWTVVFCEDEKIACPSDSGIFYSQDNGATWIFRPYDTKFTWNLVSDKKGHLFVLKYFIGHDFQLYRSSNFGASWQRILLPDGGEPTRIYIEKGGRLLVPVEKYILISTDAGETWRKLFFGALTVGRDVGGNLLAGNFEGIFRYDSTSGEWQDINNGLHARRIEAVDFTSSGSILVLSFGTCFRSTDFGRTWNPIKLDSNILLYPYAPIQATSQGEIFMAATFDNYSECGLLRSVDDGETWERISVLSNYFGIYGITEGNSGDILIATSHGDIYRSVDGGDSWNKVFSAANHSEITCITADKLGNYYAAKDTSILISHDGQAWEELPLKRQEAVFESMSIDTWNRIFLGSSRNGVFHSTDQGKTWNLINNGLFDHYVMSTTADDSGNVILGTSSGIFRLADSADSWLSFSEGFPNTYATSLSISSDGYLFAGTQDFGMYMTIAPLGKRIPRIEPPPPSVEITRFNLYQNYPNPFNDRTVIQYDVPFAARVEIKILNALGQDITTLVSGYMPQGTFTTVWSPKKLSSGVYFCKMKASSGSTTYQRTIKLLYLR